MQTKLDGFTPLLDVLLSDPAIGLSGAAVYGKIWRYCQMEHAKCWASRDRLAKELGISPKTVQRQIALLIQEGYITDLTPSRRNAPHEYICTDKVDILVQIGVTKCPTAETDEVGQNVQPRLDILSNWLDILSPQVGQNVLRREYKREEERIKETNAPTAQISLPLSEEEQNGMADDILAILATTGMDSTGPMVRSSSDIDRSGDLGMVEAKMPKVDTVEIGGLSAHDATTTTPLSTAAVSNNSQGGGGTANMTTFGQAKGANVLAQQVDDGLGSRQGPLDKGGDADVQQPVDNVDRDTSAELCLHNNGVGGREGGKGSADPLLMVLERRTKDQREQVGGGNWAVPVEAGGDGKLAAYGLLCLYTHRQRRPPKEGSKDYKQQIAIVERALDTYGFLQAPPELVKRAAEILCERKGDWVNPHYPSFVTDFGSALSAADQGQGRERDPDEWKRA